MSWPIAAAWLTVLGAFLLIVGTGAQALGSLVQYRDILMTLAKTSIMEVLMEQIREHPEVVGAMLVAVPRWSWNLRSWVRPVYTLLAALVKVPGALGQIRGGPGEEPFGRCCCCAKSRCGRCCWLDLCCWPLLP